MSAAVMSVPVAQATRHTCRLERDAGTLVYDVWQADAPARTATPILLIHGWGGTGTYWTNTAHRLAASPGAPLVIVPDLPGTGRSQPVRRAQNMYDQVGALIDLLDAERLDRVQIVGHSMGSAMALLLADSQPERVERMALTSLSFFISPMQERIYRVVMHVFSLGMHFRAGWFEQIPGMARMMAAHYFHKIPDDAALLRQGLVDYLQLDLGTAIACANNASDSSIPAAGGRVRVPSLLIACRQDQVMPPQNVEHTARVIPNCRVEWIDQCGHIPMIEQPDIYMALLRDFLVLA
jgi:pimeloyl-ACP methyl ester carboxylesterase